jgi:hypothetical protein
MRECTKDFCENLLRFLLAAILSHLEVDGTGTIRPVGLFKPVGRFLVALGICSFSPETGNQFSQNGKDLFEDLFGGELEIGFSQKDGKKKYEIARGNFDFSFLLGEHCFRFYYTTFDDGKQWFIIQVDNEDIEDSSVAAFCQDGMFQIVRCRLSKNAPFVHATSSSATETSVQNVSVGPLFDEQIPDSEKHWVNAVKGTSVPETSVQDASAPETSVQVASASETSVQGASAPETSVQVASAPDTSVQVASAPETSVQGASAPKTERLELIKLLPIKGRLRISLMKSSISEDDIKLALELLNENEMEDYFKGLLSQKGSSSA